MGSVLLQWLKGKCCHVKYPPKREMCFQNNNAVLCLFFYESQNTLKYLLPVELEYSTCIRGGHGL